MPSTMIVRPASLVDLEQITSLSIAASADDPVYPYRYPKATELPEEHRKYSRTLLAGYLENVQRGIYACRVVEAPDKDDPSMTKIIALSLWNLPGDHRSIKDNGSDAKVSKPSDFERRDANPARIAEFRKQLAQAKQGLFDDVYGDNQLGLMVLATHPDYRRLGAATTLVRWGLEKAKAEGVAAVTLFSSPMGRFVYSREGFTQVGSVHVQVEGDAEFVDVSALVWTNYLQGGI